MRTEVVADVLAHEGEFRVPLFDAGAKFRPGKLQLLSFHSFGWPMVRDGRYE